MSTMAPSQHDPAPAKRAEEAPALPPAAPPPHPRREPAFRPVQRGRAQLLGGAVAGLLVLVSLGVWLRRAGVAATAQVPTGTVTRVSFDVQVKLAGELKALRSVEIRNRVEGHSTVLFIIPEGTFVNAGDELVRLANDTLQDRVQDARIRVEDARAASVNAQESLTIQLKQNESDISNAQINAQLAQLEFDQFDQGDAVVELATRTTALENARTDLERKTVDRDRAKELATQGFVSSNDVLDAEMAFRDARNRLDTAQKNLEVWNQYAEPKQRQAREAKRRETLRELERARIKAHAAALLKAADLKAREATLTVEAARLANLQTQLANTVITAPQPGVVIYQSSLESGDHHGGNRGPIEEGAQVYPNQLLIQLPDTTQMQVAVRIAEQQVDRLTVGLPAVITIDTLPGQVFAGKLERISPVIDSSMRWLNPNLKEFPAQVPLDTTPPKLKPGMSAKVVLQVARLTDVLAVPLQAVFTEGGESYVFVGTPARCARRIVTTGLSSTEQMEIKAGLQAGETVLLGRPRGGG